MTAAACIKINIAGEAAPAASRRTNPRGSYMKKIGLTLGSIAAATTLLAGEPATLDRLLDCANIETDNERLACFDRGVQSIRGAAPTKAAALPSSPAPRDTSTSPSPGTSSTSGQDFGEEQLGRRDESDKPAKALQARIASTRSGGQGTYLVTLDNGQVWRHESGRMAQYLGPGEAVTITGAALGSYRLTRDAGKSKDWVRVTRVR